MTSHFEQASPNRVQNLVGALVRSNSRLTTDEYPNSPQRASPQRICPNRGISIFYSLFCPMQMSAT